MAAYAARLAVPLALAALAEVILLRLLMRTGAYLPRADQYADVYRGLQLLGLAAANLVSLLAVAVIVLVGLAATRGPHWVARLAGGGALVAAGAQVGLVVAPSTSVALAVATLTALALALALAGAASPLRGWARLGMLAILATDLAIIYYAVAQPARALGLDLPGGLDAYFVGEALALVGAAGALAIVRPGFRPGAAVAAVILGGLVLAGRLLVPWVTGLAIMWTVTFSLYLPGPLYALAAGLMVYALLAGWRVGGETRARTAGLLLIVLAGLKLDYGYFALMALAGFLLAAGCAAPDAFGRLAPPAAPDEASRSGQLIGRRHVPLRRPQPDVVASRH